MDVETDKMILAPKYEEINFFSEGLASFRIGEYPQAKVGFLNLEGKEVIPPIYFTAEDFSEGLSAVSQEIGEYGRLLYGYIDTKGKVLIPIQFQHAYSFSEALLHQYAWRKENRN